MSEQRKTKRIKLTTLASFFGERAVTAGIIRDLSSGGVRVLTEVALQAGDTVELKIDLPERHGALRAVARVVWHKPFDNPFHPHLVGLEFVEIGEDELAMLKTFASEYEETVVTIH
jgi:Tfp pilus assembly protein PilZ